MTAFKLNGVLYRTNDKGNYFYKSTGNVDKKGQPLMMRIAKHIWEQAFEEYTTLQEVDGYVEETVDIPEGFTIEATWDGDTYSYALYRGDKLEGRFWNHKDAVDRANELSDSDKEAEKQISKKKKTRRSKDIAFEGHGITLTAKQVDFIKLLPTTNFWENGLDSALWCDCIADDIGWNPMSVGAMISTLREKKLVVVMPQKVNGKKCKSMELTELGRQVAINLGLK